MIKADLDRDGRREFTDEERAELEGLGLLERHPAPPARTKVSLAAGPTRVCARSKCGRSFSTYAAPTKVFCSITCSNRESQRRSHASRRQEGGGRRTHLYDGNRTACGQWILSSDLDLVEIVVPEDWEKITCKTCLAVLRGLGR